MNKIILLFFLGAIIIIGCKKTDNNPPVPSSDPYYSVTVDTSEFHGLGTAFPLWVSVKKGGNTAIFINANSDARIGAVYVNDKQIADTNNIVFTNITANIIVKIRLTDSLSSARKSYLTKLITDSTWHDRVAYWRAAEGMGIREWQLLGYYSPCQQIDYYNFFPNGDYTEHHNVGSCNTVPPNLFKGTWQLGYDGKSVTTFDSSGTFSLTTIDTLTKDKFGYIFVNYQNGGKDYKVVATP